MLVAVLQSPGFQSTQHDLRPWTQGEQISTRTGAAIGLLNPPNDRRLKHVAGIELPRTAPGVVLRVNGSNAPGDLASFRINMHDFDFQLIADRRNLLATCERRYPRDVRDQHKDFVCSVLTEKPKYGGLPYDGSNNVARFQRRCLLVASPQHRLKWLLNSPISQFDSLFAHIPHRRYEFFDSGHIHRDRWQPL